MNMDPASGLSCLKKERKKEGGKGRSDVKKRSISAPRNQDVELEIVRKIRSRAIDDSMMYQPDLE